MFGEGFAAIGDLGGCFIRFVLYLFYGALPPCSIALADVVPLLLWSLLDVPDGCFAVTASL